MAREKSNCACGVQSPVIVLKTAATVLKIDVHNEGIFLRYSTSCVLPEFAHVLSRFCTAHVLGEGEERVIWPMGPSRQ